MSNSAERIIVVTGATGAQGGSVVEYLLNDPDHSFRVRATTRKLDSPKAQALAARGIEVVEADLNNVDSLKKAFKGAYGVFGLTNFWEGMSADTEVQHGKNLIDAAADAGVKHFVWSTLDHTSDPEVPHWNTKAKINGYLLEKGLPRTSLYTSYYYENHLNFPFISLTKDSEGHVVADWPLAATDGPIGGYSVAETGAYVLEAFKNPQEWIGKDLRIISDVFTPRQYVQAVRDATGKDIILKEYDMEAFQNTKSVNYELWANNQYFYKNNGNPNRDLELTKKINPSRKDHRAFVEANKEAFLSIFN